MINEIKKILEETFETLKIENIEPIGEGYDSKAYCINNEYIFKIKYSANKKKGYEKEKAIYDFINKNINSYIKIPDIEYSYITDELSILGYKKINGKFLTPKIYKEMTVCEQNRLKQDIATFLKQLHNLDYSEISNYKIDNKENVLEEFELLRQTLFNRLTEQEQKYINRFFEVLEQTDVFNGRKCLCHNDFSCNHLLLDENNKLCGIIDFGDSGIIDEYCDFIYLLEDSEEEIGSKFGMDIINLYGDISIEKAKEYQDMVERHYPIETLVYGIKNNNQEFIDKGKKLINEYINIYK